MAEGSKVIDSKVSLRLFGLNLNGLVAAAILVAAALVAAAILVAETIAIAIAIAELIEILVVLLLLKVLYYQESNACKSGDDRKGDSNDLAVIYLGFFLAEKLKHNIYPP